MPPFLARTPYDLLEFFLIRRSEINRHTETCHQGKFLLHRIIGMKLLVPVGFVAESLPDQMPPV